MSKSRTIRIICLLVIFGLLSTSFSGAVVMNGCCAGLQNGNPGPVSLSAAKSCCCGEGSSCNPGIGAMGALNMDYLLLSHNFPDAPFCSVPAVTSRTTIHKDAVRPALSYPGNLTRAPAPASYLLKVSLLR